MTQEPPTGVRASLTVELQQMRSVSLLGFGHSPPGLFTLHGGTVQPPFAHTQFWPVGQQVCAPTQEPKHNILVLSQAHVSDAFMALQAGWLMALPHGSVLHKPPG